MNFFLSDDTRMTPEEIESHSGIYDLSRIVNPENLTVGENIEISDFVFLNAGRETHIGDYSCIHSGSRVVGGGELHVGRCVAVTYNCVFITSVPSYESHMSTCVPPAERKIRESPIILEDESFIGSNSVIMPGVTIGEGAVVTALSYVDENVPPWTVRYSNGETTPRERFEPY